MFAITEEHEMLREAVRALAEDKIAPRAAEVDETGRVPAGTSTPSWSRAASTRCTSRRSTAVTARTRVATAIVIEEVARACVSSSLIPAVNKLGTMGMILAGSEELRAPIPSRGRVGRGDVLVRPVGAGAGSDAASISTRAVRDGDGWRLNGVKRWISNAGVSRYYTVMAVTDPDAGTRGISCSSCMPTTTASASVRRSTRWASRDRRPASSISTTCGSATTGLSATQVRASRPPCAPWTTPARRSPPRQSVSRRAPSTSRSDTSRSASSSAVLSAEFQGLQFMLADMAMAVDAARLMAYTAAAKAERGDADATYFSAAAKTLASDTAMRVTTDAVQLLGGYGYVKDYPVERMMRDAKITQIYEGTNQILRVVMARNLLS